MRRAHLSILLLAFCFLSCNNTTKVQSTEIDKMEMTFMAGYKPQANLPFVGVYVAQEKGYFERENLTVSIEHSTGKGEHLQLLMAGEVHVTTQDAAVLLERRADPKLPLVSIALIGQHGQQAFAALQSSNLQSPKDWEGHTVGYKGTPPPDLYAILETVGANTEKVDLINVGYDPRLLTEGKIDIYPVFKSNEPYLIRSWGYDLVLWEASDYDVPTLGLTYVTSEKILSKNHKMLTSFLRAALQGIQFAEAHPDEAVQIVMKYTGAEADPDHMKYMLQTELDDLHSAYTETKGIGWQTLEQWQSLRDMLSRYDISVPEEARDRKSTRLNSSHYS